MTWLAVLYKSRYFPYVFDFQSPRSGAPFKKVEREGKAVVRFPVMFSAASELSLKETFQNMLIWKTSRSKQTDSLEASRSKNRDIFSIILTPDRIPKFFIPSLEVDHSAFQPAETGEGVQETSPRSRPSGEVIRRPRRVRSSPEISLRKDFHNEGIRYGFSSLELGAHSDRVTQAALSLPHLAKITTPYGFLTLGESPKVHRKESLFFEYESTEFQLFVPKKTLPSVSQAWSPSRSLEISSDKGSKAKGCPNKHQKKLFQLLMKKHLPSIRKLRSNHTSEDRFVIQSELLMSCPSASLQCNLRVQ